MAKAKKKKEKKKEHKEVKGTSERDKFCHNCRYIKKLSFELPCKTCMGETPSGERYCYKNWKACSKAKK